MRNRLATAPIFVQVLALALFSVLAAQTINFAVVLLLPDPPPAGYSVAEAARALQGLKAQTADGKRLVTHIQDGPPTFTGPQVGGPMEAMLGQALSQTLGVGSDRVRVQVPLEVSPHHSAVTLSVHRLMKQDEFHQQVIMAIRDEREERVGAAAHLSMFASHAVFPPFAAAYRRADGRWSVLEPPRPLLSTWQTRMLVSFLISALMLIPVAGWTARRLARPIHAFSSAAERLGRDPQAPPLVAEGPSEVRTAVAAFNDMQEKLRRYVSERTAMVAAMAHDLRAPLMRLRFRVEAAPEEIRTRAAADIEQMDAMISAALAYARGEGAGAPHAPLDLSALAASVVDDAAETGAEASFADSERLLVTGDGLALRRMLSNLVDNAVKFAGAARVSLERDDSWAVLKVEDDGPGLPTEELERVFEPFYRPDASRDPATGGFGLGLGAARTIARAHGGEVTLENRAEGGLRAIARLPLGG
jgi:signal transduction histidine kinase